MRVMTYNELGYRIGESHHRSRVSDVVVEEVRGLHEAGVTYGELARACGVATSTVAKWCQFQRRGQTPERWVKVGRVGAGVAHGGGAAAVVGGGGGAQMGAR